MFQDAVECLPQAPPLPKEIRPAPQPELDPNYSTETRKRQSTTHSAAFADMVKFMQERFGEGQ